jgi:hypothetical protein
MPWCRKEAAVRQLCPVALAIVASLFCHGFVPSPALAQAGKQALNLTYPVGTLQVTMLLLTGGNSPAEGQEQTYDREQRHVWRLRIAAPDKEGRKTASMKLVESQEKRQGSEIWNSKQPGQAEEAVGFVYKAIMAGEARVRFDKDDAVKQVAGLDQVIADLGIKATTEERKQALAERLSLGDKMLERQFLTIQSLLPGNAVAAGDRWQAEVRAELPLIGELRTRFECRLKEIAWGKAEIEAEGTHGLSNPRKISLMGETATITRLKVRDRITLTMDVASGRVQKMQTISRGEFTLSGKDQDGQESTVTMPADAKYVMSFEQ